MRKESLKPIVQLARQIFPNSGRLTVERIQQGVSTHVYRIRWNDNMFYLRVLPERDASFAPEVLVHHMLRARSVKVPEVVYFEHYNPILQTSVMVTTEIKGNAIGYASNLADMRDILALAGKDLAIINSIEVNGFGWIQRNSDAPAKLQAECLTYRQWLHQDVDEHIELLTRTHVLSRNEVDAIQEIMLQYEPGFHVEQAYLAHGDFDVTHIYHHNGAYTGIIDFGEIRGANQVYDLGHFNIENSEGLPYLLEGYTESVHLPPDYIQRIHFSSLLTAVRRLGRRQAKRPGTVYQPDLEAVKRMLKALLA